MALASPPSPGSSDGAGSGPRVDEVELLGCEAAPQRQRVAPRLSARWRRRLRWGGILAAIAYGMVALLTVLISERNPTVHPVEVRLGDPFTVDWVALQGEDGSVGDVRPPPMASVDPVCVGFGRLDWPAERRAPSVAYCVEPSSLVGLEGGELVVIREVVAGDSTWFVLLFGGELEPGPEALVVELEGEAGNTSATEVRRSGSFAAILVPSDRRNDLRVTWTSVDGGRSSCRLTVRAGPGEWTCRW